ncbi:hypothetical protein BST61_g11192 [Cercospora zeina]
MVNVLGRRCIFAVEAEALLRLSGYSFFSIGFQLHLDFSSGKESTIAASCAQGNINKSAQRATARENKKPAKKRAYFIFLRTTS